MIHEQIQQCMDDLRRMEYRLSKIENDRIAATATRAVGGLVSQFHREMANSWGLDLKLIPDAVLAEEFKPVAEVTVVAEPPPIPTIEVPPVFEKAKK